MARRSGGPAMAATPLIGEPLTMNAMAGPEPSAMSRLSAAIACCILASPAKATDSTSMPFFAKMPCFMPTSSGTNENASGTALPTRSFSAASADAAHVIAAHAAAARISAFRTSMVMSSSLQTQPRPSFVRQQCLGINLAHVGRLRQRLHLDEGTLQDRECLGVETAGVREHRHQLVV